MGHAAMITASDIPPDERFLVRLLCEKLAGLLGGMLSVGLTSLQMSSPGSFFVGRDRPMLAIVDTLGLTSARAFSDTATELKERTTALARSVNDFFAHLTNLAGWSAMSHDELYRLGDKLNHTYATL